MKRLLVFVFAAALLGSCGSVVEDGYTAIPDENFEQALIDYGQLTDKRDGKTYKTVKIGNQTWMAENLAFLPDSGNYWAYDNDNTNVAKYGYLYDWQTAKNVCPTGWHLPSDKEWSVLTDYFELQVAKIITSRYGLYAPGTKMKSTSGWQDGGNGTNESGFNAFPVGYRGNDGDFNGIGSYGFWWSSSEFSPYDARIRYLHKDFVVVKRGYRNKTHGYSVRCIKD